MASLKNCVKERCVDEARVFEGRVRVVFVSLRLISTRLSSGLVKCNGALSVLRASRTEGCVLRKRRVYAREDFGLMKSC